MRNNDYEGRREKSGRSYVDGRGDGESQGSKKMLLKLIDTRVRQLANAREVIAEADPDELDRCLENVLKAEILDRLSGIFGTR